MAETLRSAKRGKLVRRVRLVAMRHGAHPRDEVGGVAAEYAALTAFIAGAVALAISTFGTRVIGLIELL